MSRAQVATTTIVATLVPFAWMLTASCNLSDGEHRVELILSTDRRQYASGESPSLQLFNGSDGPIGYNPCSAILEVQRNRAWQVSEIQQDAFCADVLFGLMSGGTATYEFVPSEPPPPGTYRFTLSVEKDGAPVWLASSSFVFTEASAQAARGQTLF